MERPGPRTPERVSSLAVVGSSLCESEPKWAQPMSGDGMVMAHQEGACQRQHRRKMRQILVGSERTGKSRRVGGLSRYRNKDGGR